MHNLSYAIMRKVMIAITWDALSGGLGLQHQCGHQRC